MSQIKNYYFPVGNDVIKTETGSAIKAYNSVNFPLLEMKLYGKSTQNGTPTPETPVDIVSVGDDREIKVQSCGKNLLDLSSVQSATINGVTFTVNADGTILANGTALGYVTMTLLNFNMKGDYIMTGWPKGGQHATTGALSAAIKHVDASTSYALNKGDYKIFTVDDSVVNVQIRLEMHKGAVTNNTLFYPMLRFATDKAGYESYKGNTAALSTALPLRGLPVKSGGNYTDSNGQQWVCDELTYNADGTGEIRQRCAIFQPTTVKSATLLADGITAQLAFGGVMAHGSVDVQSGAMCNRAVFDSEANENTFNFIKSSYGLVNEIALRIPASLLTEVTTEGAQEWLDGNGVTFIYPVSLEIPMPLSAEEMAQLKSLYSYSGVTNVFNDEGAEMAVKYCTSAEVEEYILPLINGGGSNE